MPSRTEGWNHPVASERKLRPPSPHEPVCLTSYPSRIRRVHNGRKSTSGSSGPPHQTDRLAAMGGSHVPSLYAHYSMRYHIALGPNVCANHSDANPRGLNFNHASTESLFNAVKKQHGNSHLLKLALPSPPPPGVPSPSLLPRLPNNPETSGPDAPQPRTQAESFDLRMIETDLASTAKFVREFAVESLIPWMEKCIREWNEAVSCPFAPPRPRDLTFDMGRLVFVISQTALPVILFHPSAVRYRSSFEFPCPRHSSTTFTRPYDLDKFCSLPVHQWHPTFSATETCRIRDHPW